MTRFPTMILYFKMCTGFTAGPNIKWDVLHALQFCTGRYSYGSILKINRITIGTGTLLIFVDRFVDFRTARALARPSAGIGPPLPPTLAPHHPPRPPRPPNRRPAAAWPSTTSETYPETSAFNLSYRSVFQAFSLAARPVDYSHARRPPSPRSAPYVVSDPRAAISPRLGPHGALGPPWGA